MCIRDSFDTDANGCELASQHCPRSKHQSDQHCAEYRDKRNLSAAGHTVSRQMRLSASISALGSEALNTALPATKVSAPARQTFSIVSRAIPPSTSSAA